MAMKVIMVTEPKPPNSINRVRIILPPRFKQAPTSSTGQSPVTQTAETEVNKASTKFIPSPLWNIGKANKQAPIRMTMKKENIINSSTETFFKGFFLLRVSIKFIPSLHYITFRMYKKEFVNL